MGVSRQKTPYIQITILHASEHTIVSYSSFRLGGSRGRIDLWGVFPALVSLFGVEHAEEVGGVLPQLEAMCERNDNGYV